VETLWDTSKKTSDKPEVEETSDLENEENNSDEEK